MNTREFLRTSTKGGAVISIAIVVRVVVGFVTQITLARLLAPEMFGKIAFATTVAMSLNAFTNLRADAYIIHQKDSPERVIDVTFTLELLSSIFFGLLVIMMAPYVMSALGKSELTIYVQVLALAFFYNPFSRIRSLLERDLLFSRSTFPSIIAQMIGSISSIALAFFGYGIWSILWWRLSVMFGEVAILWTTAHYRPRLKWDIGIAKRFLRFSWPLVGSGLLVFFSYNIDYFIVGQFLEDGDTQLGFYWLGFQAATYLLMARAVLYGVLFPLFSRIESDEYKKQVYMKFSRAVAGIFIIITTVALLFGRDIILAIYGPKWFPAVFPFQIIFIVIMMRAINSNNGYYLNSSGETMPELKSALIMTILLIPAAYFGTILFGINGTAVAVLCVQVVVNIVIYEQYIKPKTGNGVLHFFAWPWFISGLALTLALLSDYYELAFIVKLVWFFILLLIIYYSIIRSVLQDIKVALRILKPLNTREITI